MRTRAPCVLATSVWLGAPGCTAEAPTDPSWQEDVLPILVAHCSRCHAQPAHIAPDLLQWVSYDDVTGPGDATFYGAASNAMALVDSIRTGYMPKDGRFPPDEVAVFGRIYERAITDGDLVRRTAEDFEQQNNRGADASPNGSAPPAGGTDS